MSCLDENTIIEFIQGKMKEEEVSNVEVHLDQCQECRQLVNQLVRVGLEPTEQATQAGPEEVTKEHPGRYSIRDEHRRGARALVWVAFDEHTKREIALKELLPSSSDRLGDSPQTPVSQTAVAAARFLQEARITCQLEHPNIVPVYELGRRVDGTLYYTMRLVKGRTLAKALQECRQDLDSRLKLLDHFQDICNAIAYAHSRGVIHRDIKPQNVMVGEFGETVLLDWGLARVRGRPDDRIREIEMGVKQLYVEQVDKTTEGVVVGTPAYMSPEQAQGKISQIDERSDIWGLGAVLYEILTGSPPFRGKTLLDIIRKAIKEEVCPVQELESRAPAELAAVAQKALQRDPNKRYKNAKDLAEEVSAYMIGEKVSAYHYSSWQLVRRFASQNKPVVLAVTAVFTVILAALFVVVALYKREYQERLIANFHLAQACVDRAEMAIQDKRLVAAQMYAAASLLHNPAVQNGKYYDPGFEHRFPQSQALKLDAISRGYRANFNVIKRLDKVIKASTNMTQVAFSPNGRLLASGGRDGKVRIWEIRSGAMLRELGGHQGEVQGVAFSPNGTWLASASEDKTIRLWDLTKIDTASLVEVIEGHQGIVWSVAFSPQGQTLASGSFDRTVRIWDLSDRPVKLKSTIKGHQDRVTSVAFSSDGRHLASASYDQKIIIWNPDTGKRLYTLVGHNNRVFSVAFSPDSKQLASASWDRTIRLWDLNQAPGQIQPLITVEGHLAEVTSVSYSADGKKLASTSNDMTIKLWDLHAGLLLSTLEGHEDVVWSSAFSPDGKVLVSSSYDQTMHVWELDNQKQLQILANYNSDNVENEVGGLVFSPDGKQLASVGRSPWIKIWDPIEGKPIQSIPNPLRDSVGVAYSSEGRFIGFGSGKILVVWDLANGREKFSLHGHLYAINRVAFSPDDKYIISAAGDANIKVWDLSLGGLVHTLQGHEEDVFDISFSDQNRLASASYDGTVRLWDVGAGKQLQILVRHNGKIRGVDFSNNDKWLAAIGEKGFVRIWNAVASDWNQFRDLYGYDWDFYDVAFSPDNKYLVGSSWDKVVIWSVESGEPVASIYIQMGPKALAFSPVGDVLAVGEEDDIVLFPMDFSGIEIDPQRKIDKLGQEFQVEMEGAEMYYLYGD